MPDKDVLDTMVINFMDKQNEFNLKIIERISKAEVRIYLIMTSISTAIGVISKYLLP